jgi:hypothetical protein
MEPINYNRDLEQLLAQSAEECESLGILHLASYEKYNLLSNYINIPVIVLSSGIGFITGIDLNYDKMNIILGIGSVFVGIIKSIDSYFQLGKRAEAHRLCALQYTQINKKIQIELSLCREQRQTAKDMLSIIKTDIKNLQDISPIIDKEIIKEYNVKYGKYNNVKKPNFVNGLSEVKININSLEDEALASLSHSIRGGNSVSGGFNGGGGGGGFNGGGGGGGGGFVNNVHHVQNNGHEAEIQIPGEYIDMIGAAVDSATAATTAVNMARARAAVDAYERNYIHSKFETQNEIAIKTPSTSTPQKYVVSAKLSYDDNVTVTATTPAHLKTTTPLFKLQLPPLSNTQDDNNNKNGDNNNVNLVIDVPEDEELENQIVVQPNPSDNASTHSTSPSNVGNM